MHSYYTFIALDIARERAQEAEHRRLLAADAWSNEAESNGRSLRRSAAAALAAFSRASGRIAHRLDENVAAPSH